MPKLTPREEHRDMRRALGMEVDPKPKRPDYGPGPGEEHRHSVPREAIDFGALELQLTAVKERRMSCDERCTTEYLEVYDKKVGEWEITAGEWNSLDFGKKNAFLADMYVLAIACKEHREYGRARSACDKILEMAGPLEIEVEGGKKKFSPHIGYIHLAQDLLKSLE